MTLVLSVADVVKVFERPGAEQFTAVNKLSFSVNSGECFGLLGPNGAGKSTTMKMLLGLTAFNSGSIHLLNHAVPKEAREARYKVGVVPQSDALDPDFTVTENLMVYGRYFGIADSVIHARIPELLDFAQLESKKNANIKELSGGMKRRLTIARALVNDPQLLVLDEPTTGLDPQARHLIWDRLKALLTKGKTIVLTTHFMEEAERLCDRLAIMDHGRKIAQDTPQNLIATEIRPYVIELVGDGFDDWYRHAQAQWPTTFGSQLERVGATGFLYCDDPNATMQRLVSQTPLGAIKAIQRAANLEDVFLKLTGRDLRD